MKWSSPVLFNDPFDVPRHAQLDFNSADLSKAIRADLGEILHGRLETNDRNLTLVLQLLEAEPNEVRREEIRSSLIASMADVPIPTESALDDFAKLWDEILSELRILCVSEVKDSVTMWAHYAENHAGVVLEFEVSDELDSSLLLAQPVVYSDTPPALPPKEAWARALATGAPIDWQEYFRQYHFYKTTNWREEREWRAITYDFSKSGKLYSLQGFHPRELRALYLGAHRAPDADEAVIDLLNDDLEHVAVYKGDIDYRSRGLNWKRLR